MNTATDSKTISSPPFVVGAIVLNWNGYEDTVNCLESLVRCNGGPERIVVVDNGSSDDSVTKIKFWATQHGISHDVVPAEPGNPPVAVSGGPVLTLLHVDTNLGFAGGNNLGLRYLESDSSITHFLLLNNDATVAQDFFFELSLAVKRFPNAGLLTGTIFEAENPERVWYAGGGIRTFGTLASHGRQVPPGSDPVVTGFVCGCTMLISRDALRAVGRLAECYSPIYVEDVEYSFRVAAAGLPVLYAPTARVYHKVSAAMRNHSAPAFMAYCMSRHRAFFARRNLQGWMKWAALTYLALYNPARALLYMMAGRPRVGWALLRGTAVGFLSREATR